jgi:hypothetical protein
MLTVATQERTVSARKKKRKKRRRKRDRGVEPRAPQPVAVGDDTALQEQISATPWAQPMTPPGDTSVEHAVGKEPQSSADSRRSYRTAPRLDLEFGVGGGGRRMTFEEPEGSSLRPYEGLAPALSIGGRYFPMARNAGTNTVLRGLGLHFSLFTTPYLSSKIEGTNDKVSTEWTRWAVGPSLRLRLSEFEFEAFAHYGKNTFQIRASTVVAADQLPSVSYRYVGGGLTLGFRNRSTVFRAKGEYNHNMASGRVAKDLNASTRELKGTLRLGKPSPSLGIDWGFDISYAYVSYQVRTGGVAFAQGARDTYATAQLFIAKAW